MRGEASATNSGYALLHSAGIGGLGREIREGPTAVAAVCGSSAAPEEHPAGAENSESHLQPFKCFLFYSRSGSISSLLSELSKMMEYPEHIKVRTSQDAHGVSSQS